MHSVRSCVNDALVYMGFIGLTAVLFDTVMPPSPPTRFIRKSDIPGVGVAFHLREPVRGLLVLCTTSADSDFRINRVIVMSSVHFNSVYSEWVDKSRSDTPILHQNSTLHPPNFYINKLLKNRPSLVAKSFTKALFGKSNLTSNYFQITARLHWNYSCHSRCNLARLLE
jgi:hypothetical protein